jgi:hypothetical protein
MCFWVNHREQGFRLLPFPELLHWRFQWGDDAQELEYGKRELGDMNAIELLDNDKST